MIGHDIDLIVLGVVPIRVNLDEHPVAKVGLLSHSAFAPTDPSVRLSRNRLLPKYSAPQVCDQAKQSRGGLHVGGGGYGGVDLCEDLREGFSRPLERVSSDVPLGDERGDALTEVVEVGEVEGGEALALED